MNLCILCIFLIATVSGKCAEYTRPCYSWDPKAQIADVFSDSKKVTKFRMQHIIYDSKCEVVLSQWIYDYTVSGCSIQNANYHRCNVTMISATGLVTKELVEANRLDCGKLEINTWYALRNIHCSQDGYDVFYYLRKTMNRIMERRLLLTDEYFMLDGIKHIASGSCPIRWAVIVNWLIGIFLVCVFLYILYSAWRMYLRIQYYTMQN
ncbi:hypothetical protein WA577_005705, partial [Blastocystis sp. JDR]